MTLYWKVVRRGTDKVVYAAFLSAEDAIIKTMRNEHAAEWRSGARLVPVEITADEFRELRRQGK